MKNKEEQFNAFDNSAARRQSAPRPEASDYAAAENSAALDGFKALNNPIGREQIHKAANLLNRYIEGKKNLDQKIIDNEQWYKLRHWECMRDEKKEVQPVSAWLFNCIANKHADAMDNFPSPNILPREEGDKYEAEKLTAIIPVILDQCEFEQVYSDVWMYKLKSGTGVYSVLWDKDKLNGLGDISIQKVDLLNLFWEPGITDIQNSKNVFHTQLVDNETLTEKYPQLNGKLGTSTINVSKYIYDDKVETSEKSIVVDWYYRKRNADGKAVLHYCKFVNDEVLFATENDEEFSERGIYDHGLYPFVFDTLYPIEGTPAGFGYIDIGKDTQAYIDRGNQAIISNLLVNSKPRFFIRNDGSVNEEEFADLSNDFIHTDGNLAQDSIIPVRGNPLNGIYVSVINNKIDELKETTGNRDISTGGTSSGVTAASAIAAMQEAGSKLSRDNCKSSYRAFKKLCLMVIELVRQFYGVERSFRIMGSDGAARYIEYSNEKIRPQEQGFDFDVDLGARMPLFDIEVTAQKQNPYSKMSQNEMALQFYAAGFFNPELSDQALACLEMMDFERKQFVIKRVTQNGTMYQQLAAMQQQMMMLAQMVDKNKYPDVAEQLAVQFGAAAQQAPADTKGGAVKGGFMRDERDENGTTAKARRRTAEMTEPR